MDQSAQSDEVKDNYEWYKCDVCSCHSYDKSLELRESNYTNPIHKTCEFCLTNPTSYQILTHQIERMESMLVSDFPSIFRRLIKHLVLNQSTDEEK